MAAGIDFSGMQDLLVAQYREHESEFLQNLLIENMPFKKYMLTESGVADELTFSKMTMGNVLQPGGKDTFNPIKVADLTARFGKVRDVKIDLKWTPTEQQALARTYINHIKGNPDLSYESLPFAEFLLSRIGAAAKNDLARTLVWQGIYNNSNSGTVDSFDGLKTIAGRSSTYNKSSNPNPGLPSTRKVASASGGMVQSTAIADFEKLLDKVPAADLLAYEWALVCDPTLEKLYARDYRATYGSVIYNDSYEKKSPDGASTVEIIPEVGMAGTGEMFLFPKGIPRFLADDESKIDALRVETAERNLKVMVDFKAAVEWASIDDVYQYTKTA